MPAGNQLGKDFVTAFAVLWFFCSRRPCRIITSSSGQAQLRSVLWGEMRRFINTSKYPLPIQIPPSDLIIRHSDENGLVDPLSYVLGMVTNVPENLLGHHLPRTRNEPRTLAVFDEASSIDNAYWDAVDTWAHRKLVIGNPLPCTNFFKSGVKGGDLLREDDKPDKGYVRKIIKIKAEQSPNVRVAKERIARGLPAGDPILPGVVDYELYLQRRKYWDKVKQCVGLDAEFYEGAEVLLYPPDWLDRAEAIAELLRALRHRQLIALRSNRVLTGIRTMGVDAAEGGDDTVWTICDLRGIIYQLAIKTSNTNDIPGRTIQLVREYQVDPKDVLFDRGGGGKQHADALRAKGFFVRTIGFGESATNPEKTIGGGRQKAKKELEQRYIYKNRRAEMYGILRNLLDPGPQLLDALGNLIAPVETSNQEEVVGFAIPVEHVELRRQLAPLPLLYDGEGRLYLPPKQKPSPGYQGTTIQEILGRSPDHADSLALAVFGLIVRPARIVVGAM